MKRCSVMICLSILLLIAAVFAVHADETYLTIQPEINDFLNALDKLIQAGDKIFPLYDRDLGESTETAAKNASEWGVKLRGYSGVAVPTQDVQYFRSDLYTGKVLVPTEDMSLWEQRALAPKPCVSAHDMVKNLDLAVRRGCPIRC